MAEDLKVAQRRGIVMPRSCKLHISCVLMGSGRDAADAQARL